MSKKQTVTYVGYGKTHIRFCHGFVMGPKCPVHDDLTRGDFIMVGDVDQMKMISSGGVVFNLVVHNAASMGV